MSTTWATLIIVACGVVLGGLALCAIGWAAIALDHALDRRRRRDRIALDGRDAVEAWLDVSALDWPTRAPRNGDPFDDRPEELSR